MKPSNYCSECGRLWQVADARCGTLCDVCYAKRTGRPVTARDPTWQVALSWVFTCGLVGLCLLAIISSRGA